MGIPSCCQVCGIEAPVKFVEFHYNIGAIAVRYRRSVSGYLCKPCIHKKFWKFTALDLTLGWWGMISMVVTPIFFVNNVVRYLGALTMASPSQAARSGGAQRGDWAPQRQMAGAAAPGLPPPSMISDQLIERLAPFAGDISRRIGQREPIPMIAEDIGRRAGVTGQQVVAYTRRMGQLQGQR